MDPIKAVVSLLWISVCVGIKCNEAAVLGSLPHTPDAADNGLGSHLVERSRETNVMYRKDPSINGTVVLHDYMVFLYRTLSQLQQRENVNVSRSTGFANTVTSFVDQGNGW